jgi:hypothetical protein
MDPHRIAMPDRPSSGNPAIAGRLREMADRLEAHGANPFCIAACRRAGEAATRRAFMAQLRP